MNRVVEHLKTSFKKIRLLPHYSRSAVGDIPAHRGYGGKGVGRNHGYRDKEYSSEATHTHTLRRRRLIARDCGNDIIIIYCTDDLLVLIIAFNPYITLSVLS